MTENQKQQPKEPLFERRARVQQQLDRQRAELAAQWRALEQQVYVQERRIRGFTRGFRAVLPVGAAAGALWLIRRYGPARFARPMLFGLTTWNFLRRLLAFRGLHRAKDRNGHSASWLPIAVTLLNLIQRRHAPKRRDDASRSRTAAYRGGRRDGGLRRAT